MIEGILSNIGWDVAVGVSAWVLAFGFFLRALGQVLRLRCERGGDGRADSRDG